MSKGQIMRMQRQPESTDLGLDLFVNTGMNFEFRMGGGFLDYQINYSLN
jgi:hypothetical protein